MLLHVVDAGDARRVHDRVELRLREQSVHRALVADVQHEVARLRAFDLIVALVDADEAPAGRQGLLEPLAEEAGAAGHEDGLGAASHDGRTRREM
ncbi:MAG: hypothetical protein A2V88_08095 [Elusimicrobia bacterium RBG_16_66_12]|nr:MAG: hypothetical protein A2V88_08095 [Elusimicrobia bacterium RBG_16_66_12]